MKYGCDNGWGRNKDTHLEACALGAPLYISQPIQTSRLCCAAPSAQVWPAAPQLAPPQRSLYVLYVAKLGRHNLQPGTQAGPPCECMGASTPREVGAKGEMLPRPSPGWAALYTPPQKLPAGPGPVGRHWWPPSWVSLLPSLTLPATSCNKWAAWKGRPCFPGPGAPGWDGRGTGQSKWAVLRGWPRQCWPECRSRGALFKGDEWKVGGSTYTEPIKQSVEPEEHPMAGMITSQRTYSVRIT